MVYLKNDSDCAMEQSEPKKREFRGWDYLSFQFSVDGSEMDRSHRRWQKA